MPAMVGILSEMLENLSSHKDARAREVYLRRICPDLDIRETVFSYEHDEEPYAPQLAISLEPPKPIEPRRIYSKGKPKRPPLERHRSSARSNPERLTHLDYDKFMNTALYHADTDVPTFLEDWTTCPFPPSEKEKLWQDKFHGQAQPFLKLSALLNMPVEESKVLFPHYDVDDAFRQALALLAGAAMPIPTDGTRSESGTLPMLLKAIKGLDRANGKRVGRSLEVDHGKAWA
jgi:hypothetical protein